MEAHPPPTPWLDLPISLTESILERLPLPDYVTFAAVCPKWRSIQQNHRLLGGRHLSIPWLITFALQQDEEDPPQETLIPCYSPFEHHRLRRLRLPLSLPNHRFCASSRGWILLHDKHISEATNAAADTKKKRRRRTRMSRKRRRYSPPLPHLMFFALLNPISGRYIHLPPIHLALPYEVYIAAMSPPPCPTVLVITDDSLLFLFRSGDPGDWTVLPCPEGVDIIKTSYCGGKFYCTSEDMSLVVVDPCSDPTLEYFEMDPSMLRPGPDLVVTLESDGELLLVKPFMNIEGRFDVAFEDFQVFKVDLLRKKWVRVESLGDRALILGQHSSVSLLADDFGGRRNCIYSSETLIAGLLWPTEWKVFDLGTERMAEWLLPDTLSEYDCSQINKYSWSLIVPSLQNVCENVNDETVGGMAGISQLLLPMPL